MASQENKEFFKKVDTIKVDIVKEDRPDGVILMRSAIPLESHPYRLTERLKYWAENHPDRIFIGRKNEKGKWIELTYAETFSRIKNIAQSLLDKNLSSKKPIAILSENSIEHALLALAAMHIGIPHTSVTPAYSLRSTDFNKLKHVIGLLDPGLIFVSDTKKYFNALQAVGRGIDIVTVTNRAEIPDIISFDEFLETPVTPAVEKAYEAIQPQTIAKILFTSGSTGLPKGVINTHENISANWQQITQTFPFLKDEGLEFIDWLPWNHTFGGNHNLGLAVYNGGSFYIDDGNPTPEGILTTVASLKERNPSIYFNVPKGFEELIPYFKHDPRLRKFFFSNLKMLFYAGAGMPQHVWDAWENLALETIGKKILIGTGLGCTESSPSALFASEPGGFAGLLGVPVPGLELKLVPSGGKLEARYRGKNIFPGYWRQPELSSMVFDEEGFYCTGDALLFADKNDPNKGMIFDGRFAEDFKLTSGTWVRVGVLRSQIISAAGGLIQDLVIAGHDRDFIGAIIFPALEYCKKLTGLNKSASIQEIIHHPAVKSSLQKILEDFAKKNMGSAGTIKRVVLADFSLSIDKGEITDKGTINQRMVIQTHPELIRELYAEMAGENIIEIKADFIKETINL